MNILWLINIALPEASQLMNSKISPYGGWLINASQDLAKQENVTLTVLFPHKGQGVELNGPRIQYYTVKPVKDNNREATNDNMEMQRILSKVKPDLVHIFGTEMPHTLAMVNACKKLGIKHVISIQGLVSVYSKHMYANLPLKTVYGVTIRNILRRDHVYGLKRLFAVRGKYEIRAIQKSDYIIGRTTWDKACISQINPKAAYHFCNETLREEFYNRIWSFEKCEQYSIFLSQGQYPIKGLHYAIEAMDIIVKRYPQARMYISGKDIVNKSSTKDRLLLTCYGKYILSLIKKFKLQHHITFTGPLNEQEMCEQYLKSHVFVCPSSIENSPNSLGEAMILGVPCVASYVGGIPDMLEHNEEGYLYQADAPYMMAHYVCEIFSQPTIATKFSANARKRAVLVHDPQKNTEQLMRIYQLILKQKEGLTLEKN